MQFEAVSKASAFMVHDLKTVIAQLSLLVKNAPKHRNNPAFIDDMINTTDHAVRKMSSLVDHIRRPGGDDDSQLKLLNLADLTCKLVEHHQRQAPAPRIDGEIPTALIKADEEQLRSVLGHLIQNAQDATPPTGDISIALKLAKGKVVLFIQDTGTGMTREFISSQLFKPFESTKGLTGMGIGAYQAREYIRRIGGDIDVTPPCRIVIFHHFRRLRDHQPAAADTEIERRIGLGIVELHQHVAAGNAELRPAEGDEGRDVEAADADDGEFSDVGGELELARDRFTERRLGFDACAPQQRHDFGQNAAPRQGQHQFPVRDQSLSPRWHRRRCSRASAPVAEPVRNVTPDRFLADGETVHNAFPDRDFPGE